MIYSQSRDSERKREKNKQQEVWWTDAGSDWMVAADGGGDEKGKE